MDYYDTSRFALQKQYEVMRTLGMEARARMTFELSNNLRNNLEAGVRSRHPEWGDEAVRIAMLRLMVGEELYQTLCQGRPA